jgi:hypothetical protein
MKVLKGHSLDMNGWELKSDLKILMDLLGRGLTYKGLLDLLATEVKDYLEYKVLQVLWGRQV